MMGEGDEEMMGKVTGNHRVKSGKGQGGGIGITLCGGEEWRKIDGEPQGKVRGVPLNNTCGRYVRRIVEDV